LRSASIILGFLGQHRCPALAKRYLGKHAKHRSPSSLRQHRPNRLTGLAHRVIPATEPAREALPGPVSAVRSSRLNYQRYHEWDIGCGLRDTKDLRFGMGMGTVHVSTPERRDRLWLLNALAIALLTLLGAAGEALGYDRYLKSNTAKRRTHSLFRQGCMLYELIPTMPETRLLPLIERFAAMLAEVPTFADTFGPI
jgi:hypothetical protein